MEIPVPHFVKSNMNEMNDSGIDSDICVHNIAFVSHSSYTKTINRIGYWRMTLLNMK